MADSGRRALTSLVKDRGHECKGIPVPTQSRLEPIGIISDGDGTHVRIDFDPTPRDRRGDGRTHA